MLQSLFRIASYTVKLEPIMLKFSSTVPIKFLLFTVILCSLLKIYVRLVSIFITNVVSPDRSTTFNTRCSCIKLEQFHPLDLLSVFSSIAKNNVSAFGIFTLYWNLFSDLPSTGNKSEMNKYKLSSFDLSLFLCYCTVLLSQK